MDSLFTKSDAWNGGHYELAVELPRGQTPDANRAVAYLWSHPCLHGCYRRHDREPDEQAAFSPPITISEGHLYGVAALPNGKSCACGSFVGDYAEDGRWLTFYTPLGSLGSIYPVHAYPFHEEGTPSPEPWIKEVNNWFRDIANHLSRCLSFDFAMVGFEVNFFDVRHSLARGVPHERWDSFLIREKAELKWYPQTIFLPPHVLHR